MKVYRHEKAKVSGSETKPEKPAIGQLEGARKPARKVVASARPSRREAQLVERFVTRMEPGSPYPLPFDALRVKSCKRRYVSNESVAITGYAYKIRDGHKAFALVIASDGTASSYVDCWRIKKISCFSINYVDNSTTVDIRPVTNDLDTNCFNDREASFACSSRSEAMPGHMVIIPAKDTPMGCWHRTSTVNPTGSLFIINVDYGGASSGNWATVTVDIDFEYVENIIGAPQGFTFTSTNTTPGTMGGCNTANGGLLLQDINVLGS